MQQKLFSITQGSGADLVLLHGWGMHSGIWQPLLPALTTRFKVTLIDLPGFGHSQITDNDYDLNTVTNAVLAVAPKKALWLGWSLGGLIALNVASIAPERIVKLITVASSPKFLQADHWPGMSAELLLKFDRALRLNYQQTLQHFLMLQFHGGHTDRKLLTTLREQLLLYGLPASQALMGGLTILQQTDLRRALAEIKCPVLALFGRLDVIVPVAVKDQCQQLNANIETHVFAKASHAPFITHPQEFIKVINEYMLLFN